MAADLDQEAVNGFIAQYDLKKARAAKVNADDEAALNRFVKDSKAQAVLCMLPARYGYSVAKAALAAGIPFVSSSYAGDLPRCTNGPARPA